MGFTKSITLNKALDNRIFTVFSLAFTSIRLYNAGMSQVLILYRLQKIDSQRDQIKARLIEIEKLLNSDQAVHNALKDLKQAEEIIAKSRQALQLVEDAVQAQRIKLEQDESALYGGRIHNPKELQDLQAEVASLKKHLASLEDDQLDAMLILEQNENSHKDVENKYKTAQNLFASQKAGLLGEQMALTKDLNRLDAERLATAAAVLPENQKLYERLRQQKRGLAVASLSDNSCDACGSILTPGDHQTSRSPSIIFFCPSCGRILYAG